MRDLIEKEQAIRAFQGGVASRVLRQAQSALIGVCLLFALYAATIVAGLHEAAKTDGIFRSMHVRHPAIVYRDSQYVPHIRAQSDRDGYFAEGFVEGSDRLFQMDLVRRYVYGRLSEVLAPAYLATDEDMRTLDARDIVDREWRALPQSERTALQAFSDGVNAAIQRQPLPVEFRLLLYRPERWTPQDSLAVVFGVCASIGDGVEDVRARDEQWNMLGAQRFADLLPLSDREYDVTASGNVPRQPHETARIAWAGGHPLTTARAGSNAWAAGSARSVDGHALLANDPHLNAGIPGFWYALEIRTPNLHVAGVTIPGIPGVILGHNDRVAWGSTNGIATTLSVFDAGNLSSKNWRTEVFHLRFGKDVRVRYYRGAHEFGGEPGVPETLVRWPMYDNRRSALTTILALDRARSTRDAMRAIAMYAGPPQNFVVAGADGRIAYHLAGAIPNDPAWGRYIHEARDLRSTFAPIPFDRLPAVAPSRSAIAVSANNKMYGAGYPYRLSAMFAPPYRAYRIAELLHVRARYDWRYFAAMQLDTFSNVDAAFARQIARYAQQHPGYLPPGTEAALKSWRGRFAPYSHGAAVEHALRAAAESISVSPYGAIAAARSASLAPEYADALRDAATGTRRAWSDAGKIDVLHPFGTIGFPFLNGAPLPGDGDEYTIHVQTEQLSQSFRAVWEPGQWDRGGLSLPTGESGEIGSGHYDDLRAAWIRGKLQPLPFDDSSVRRAAREKLVLLP